MKIIIVLTVSYNILAHTDLIFKNKKENLPLYTLIINCIGIMMYKHTHGHTRSVLNDVYVKNSQIHFYNTRTDHFRIAMMNNFTSSTCARMWNILMLLYHYQDLRLL